MSFLLELCYMACLLKLILGLEIVFTFKKFFFLLLLQKRKPGELTCPLKDATYSFPFT